MAFTAPAIDVDDPAASIIEPELALHADDRSRAAVAELGPGAADLAAAMDAATAAQLAELRTTVAAGGSIAEVSAARAPASDGAVLVALRVPAPGFNSMLVWATLLTSLGDFVDHPVSGTVEGRPETVTIGGNSGTVATTTTVNAVVSGSQLSVDITLRTQGQVTHSATGAVLYSIDSTASGHVDVDVCPDVSGHSTAHATLTSSESYSSGGASRSITKEMKAEVDIAVGDDANVTRVEGTIEGDEQASGGVAPAGGGPPPSGPTTRTSSDNIANDGNGNRLPDVPRAIQLGGEGTTVDEQVRLWGSTNLFMETTIAAATKEAAKRWQSGTCLELVVDPEGGDTDPNAETTVTATLRHRIEGNELDKPVTATLSGVAALEPNGDAQPAPATVTYTAGADDGATGTIAFKSVSNRGIADKSVTFTVHRAAWTVAFSGTDTETFGPLTNTFTTTIDDLRVTADDDGALSGTGQLHLVGTVTTSAGGAAECTGPLDQTAPVTATGTLDDSGTELHVVLRASSPPGQMVHLTCTTFGGSIELDLPAEGYADRFGEPLTALVLPVAGGSTSVSASTAVGGVVTVTVVGAFEVAPATV